MNIYEQATKPKLKYVGSGLCKQDYDGYTETYVVLGFTQETEEENVPPYILMKHKYYIVTVLNLRTHRMEEFTAQSYVERTEANGVTNIIDIEFS